MRHIKTIKSLAHETHYSKEKTMIQWPEIVFGPYRLQSGRLSRINLLDLAKYYVLISKASDLPGHSLSIMEEPVASTDMQSGFTRKNL